MKVLVRLGEPAKCPYCKGNDIEHKGYTREGCLWHCYNCDLNFERILRRIKDENSKMVTKAVV